MRGLSNMGRKLWVSPRGCMRGHREQRGGRGEQGRPKPMLTYFTTMGRAVSLELK